MAQRVSSLQISILRAVTPEWLAILPIALAVAGGWCLTGVSVADVCRFVLFEALYVVFPGCAAYMLLTGSRARRLTTLAVGWPLGYALELAAFAATAAIGDRSLFELLPLVTIVIAGALMRSRRRSLAGTSDDARRHDTHTGEEVRALPYLVFGLVLAVAFISLAIRFFASNPLPGHQASVAYSPDLVFAVSLSAEAVHHWPITYPVVAGLPLHYYTGSFMQVAAVKQVTGIDLFTIIMRLFPTTMMLVIALQLLALGRLLQRSLWGGVIAAALYFQVATLDLDPTRFQSLWISSLNLLSESQSFAFGVPFFLALLIMLYRPLSAIAVASKVRKLGAEVPKGETLRSLVIVACLTLAAGMAKTFAVIDFLGGLGLLWAWLVVTGRPARLLGVYLLASTVSAALVYGLVLAGASGGLTLRPLDFIRYTIFSPVFGKHSALGVVLLIGAAAFACFCALAPLLAAGWVVGARDRLSGFVALCLAILATGLVCFLAVGAPRFGQLYFPTYGYLAAVPVAGLGLTRLWGEIPEGARGIVVRWSVGTLMFGLVLGGSARALTAAGVLAENSHEEGGLGSAWASWYVIAYALMACVLVCASLRLRRTAFPDIRSRVTQFGACCVFPLVALGLAQPLGLMVPNLRKIAAGSPTGATDSESDRGINEALYSGLIWVRHHTSDCDVLAVSNHSTSASKRDSRYFYYSAVTERRIYLESWTYTIQGLFSANPFPRRLALSEQATTDGSAQALRQLGREGVSYVLIDKSHGGHAREPAGVSELVFGNSALDVYRLTGYGGSCRARRA